MALAASELNKYPNNIVSVDRIAVLARKRIAGAEQKIVTLPRDAENY
jgi:hypothetical protein